MPLIYEVIPMLEKLEHALDCIYNAEDEPPVIRIAAQAALQVVGKYYALTDDNEVYRIAISESPSLLYYYSDLSYYNSNVSRQEAGMVQEKPRLASKWPCQSQADFTATLEWVLQNTTLFANSFDHNTSCSSEHFIFSDHVFY